MSTWGEASSDFSDNSKRQRPVYSQSFNRGGGGGGGRGAGNRRNDDRSRNDSGKWNGGGGGSDQKTITVETRSIGRIVGRGGANIRQLEQDSRCRIFVDKEGRTETTNVRISGSGGDIEKACEMIESLLSNEFSDSRGSNRGGFNNDNDDRGRDNDRFGRDNRQRRDDRGYRQDDRRGRDDDRGTQNTSRSYNNQNDDNYSQSTFTQSDYPESTNDTHENNATSNSAVEDDFVPIDWARVYAESARAEAEHLASLPKIVKNTYIECPEVANMTPEQVAEFRQNNMKISVERVFPEHEGGVDKPIPNPILTFEHAFGQYPEVMQTIKDQGFEKPSPIQCQAWPVIMSGEDMIGIAQTGTGKTLAFLLPAFLHIESQPTPRKDRVGPSVLIISPTRELAQQIEKEINKYSYRNIKCVCVYGGGNRKDQMMWIKRDRPEIVVATPGRLDDFVMGGEVDLDSTTYVVLDEADKMLEMGFECQIRKILINVRKDRQSVMTSATWPSAVRRLASQYSVNPVQVVVGSLDLTAVHSVTQDIIMVDEGTKRTILDEFLQNLEPEDKVIVFCGKKCVTDDIAADLALNGVKCQSLHGDREQIDREQALDDLKSGEVRILIATDVAARGIDIPDITHIFNYDFPKNIEEYVHRIGRTGRAGKYGKSISLFCRRDWANAAELINILQEANQAVPEELIQMSERFASKKERDAQDRRFGGRGRGGGGGGGRGHGGFNRDRDFDGFSNGGNRSRGGRNRY